MACETIQEKLVAEEELDQTERAHLEGCADCQAFAVTLSGVARAGAGLAGFGQATPAEVTAVREQVEARLAPKPVARRLAFALPALSLGVLGVVAMLAVGSGPDAAKTGEAMFALMDEVDEFAIHSDRVAVVVGSDRAAGDESQEQVQEEISLLDEVDGITADAEDDEAFGLLTDLFDEPSELGQDEESWELSLPDGYQVLDDVLEERWL